MQDSRPPHFATRTGIESGLFGLLATCCVVCVLTVAASGAAAAERNAMMSVGAYVLPTARAQVSFQAEEITITERDVRNGFLEVAAASRVVVTTNSRAGYFIDFHPRSDLFRSVHIDGFGGQAELGADGGTIAVSGTQTSGVQQQLNYRFALKPGAEPGTYHWPLMLAVRAR